MRGARGLIERKLSNSQYRGDVDGLRALAITTVFINHAHKTWLPSGFVGVDIFFVISGFVVTWSLIGHEGDRSGILGFWRRRILRILPALIVAVIGGLALLALFFSVAVEQHFSAAVRTGLAALFGVSNIYLLRGASDYFLLDQSINIFTHTWSLGVEEQFYLFFAMLFFGLRSFGGARWKALFLWSVSGLSLVSFALFVSQGMKGDLTIYYGLHARFWELGIGAMLAVAVSMRSSGKGSGSDWRAESAAGIGAAMMIVAAFLPHGLRTEFVLPVIISVIGAALVIGAGAFRSTLVGRAFAHPVLIYVGLLSYSLYLWHWPVLSLFRISVGLSLPAIIAAVMLTGLLAWLSFNFVEAPAQRYKGPLGARILPIAGTAIAATILIGVAVTRTQGDAHVGAPFDRDDWLPPIARAYAPSGALSAAKCLLHGGAAVPQSLPEACRLKPSHPLPGAPGVLLIGDSHAFATFAMIGGLEKRGFRGAALVHDGCPIFRPADRVPASCTRYWERVPSYIAQFTQPGDVVLFTGVLPSDRAIDVGLLRDRLMMLSKATEQSGARLAVELPHISAQKPAVFCRREWFRFDYAGCERPKAAFEVRRAPMTEILGSASGAMPQPMLLWDPLQYLCRGANCSATDGSLPVLRDINHISARSAAKLSEPFATFLLDHQHRDITAR